MVSCGWHGMGRRGQLTDDDTLSDEECKLVLLLIGELGELDADQLGLATDERRVELAGSRQMPRADTLTPMCAVRWRTSLAAAKSAFFSGSARVAGST